MHTSFLSPFDLWLLMVCIVALYTQTRTLHRGRSMRAKEKRRSLLEEATKEQKAHEDTRAALKV